MRQLLCGLVLVFEAGCGSRHVPLPTVSASWSTVEALTPGTELAVYLGEQEVRNGRLARVSTQDLVISAKRSIEAFPRQRIHRIAIRTSTGISRRGPIIKSTVVAAALSAGFAWLAQAWAENPPHNQFNWKFVVLGTAVGAGLGSIQAPTETFRERLVYIRP
jgi:hypothetical protein